MSCKSCHSDNQTLCPSEICIHFPGGLRTSSNESLMVFPQLLVCLKCGLTEFPLPEAELRCLREGCDKRTA
jgi:hypothetical protein